MTERDDPAGIPDSLASANDANKDDKDPISTPMLRVTTWNILAPLMGGDKMFPGIPAEVHDQKARRPVIQSQMRALASDIVLLQEARKEELRALLNEGEAPLRDLFEMHYVPERSWQQVGAGAPDEAERGAAVLWRRGAFQDVVALDEGLCSGSPGPPCIAMLKGNFIAWNEEVMFFTAHLDGDAPVPAVARAQEQLLTLAVATAKCSKEDLICRNYVFGGDCNLTSYARVLRKLPQDGLRTASSSPKKPTCFSVVASARFDHVFAQGRLEAVATEIPECPIGNCCPAACFCHSSQVMIDCLGFSKPKVQLPFWERLGLLGCFLPWCCAAVCCFALPLPRSHARCRWALKEWGSDHVPVTVTFRRPALEDKPIGNCMV